jgi:UDP:flavonoid glycosyltransferase YjiC (YdhE family)
MARLVVTTMGSWGDLFPSLAIAKAAAARGHEVSLAATPAYRELVEAEGVRFVPVGPRFGPEEFAADPAILDGRMGGFAGFRHLFRTVVFPNLRAWVEDLRAAVAGVDLLVSHPAVLATPIAAELERVPWTTFSVFPGLVPSDFTLPSPTRARPGGATGRMLCRAAWRVARWNTGRSFDPPVNEVRAALGLRAVRDALFVPVSSGHPYLVGASPHVVDVPPDWPPNVRLTGFFAWDSPAQFGHPAELDSFLASGSPPVLVTLGGSSAVDPGDFYESAVAAVCRLGRRALVLAGPTPGPVLLDSEPDVLALPYAPFSEVAPRCLAAVHHGGIGTSVACLAAGLPQLLVPRGFDQPQTALRMRRLGVGTSLPWTRATAVRLQRELARLLGEPVYRQRAEAVAVLIRHEDGLRQVVDELERQLDDPHC